MRWIVAGLLLFAWCGCHNLEPQHNKTYLDIDSLFAAQAYALTAAHASLQKTVTFEDSTNSNLIHPDSAGWQNEFRILKFISDINKAAYRDQYSSLDTMDRSSNLHAIDIVSRKDIPVQRVRLLYQNHSALRRIEAKLRQDKLLYKKEQYVQLLFDRSGDQILITEYHIDGGQHILFGDSLRYRLDGKIVIPPGQ